MHTIPRDVPQERMRRCPEAVPRVRESALSESGKLQADYFAAMYMAPSSISFSETRFTLVRLPCKMSLCLRTRSKRSKLTTLEPRKFDFVRQVTCRIYPAMYFRFAFPVTAQLWAREG